jgi:hypothetical protein
MTVVCRSAAQLSPGRIITGAYFAVGRFSFGTAASKGGCLRPTGGSLESSDNTENAEEVLFWCRCKERLESRRSDHHEW